jgi:plastocyanin
MKRREFLGKAGVGSAAIAALTAKSDAAVAKNQQSDDEAHDHGHGSDDNVSGPLASATMTFGSWQTDPPLDRFPNLSDRTRNNHHMTPQEVTIKAGGTVNFIISGFHQVLVYGPDTKPEDVSLANPIVRTGLPPLVNDANDRIYRGLDPASLLMPPLPNTTTPLQSIQDRVEAVQFQKAGRFLVICGVIPHFFVAATGEFVMFGYVRVLD